MFENMEWLFFDVGSTLVDERAAYEHRMRDISRVAGESYEKIYDMVISFYQQNRKGDLETAKLYDISKLEWHSEDEKLYEDTASCLEALSKKYKIGVIANQSLGTAKRLEKFGILQYIDLVIASAEEGVAKPDRRIFEIALERSGCTPEKAIMIGDRIDNDIVPAKAMGMRTIWIKQGFGALWNITKKEEEPDCSVSSLTELKTGLVFKKLVC